MIVDTHTHLYLPEFDADRSEVVNRALNAGVGMMILPNIDRESVAALRRMHDEYPDCTRMAMGLHPTEIRDDAEEVFSEIHSELKRDYHDYVAVGEIGVDLYWDKTFRERQMELFDRQCSLAIELDKPVIIHCREALDEVREVISGHNGLRGVMHSFGGSASDIDRIRSKSDLYFGINGIATFKNSRLGDTIREITAERLVVETDAPYLAPVPHRGKRNESSYITSTLHYCASTLGQTFDSLAEITTKNSYTLFRL